MASLGAAPTVAQRAQRPETPLGAGRRPGPAVVDPSRPGGTYRPLRSAYLRVTRRADLPGFDETDLVMLDRAFLTVEPREGAEGSLTLVPASRYGPPEKIYFDVEAT